MANPHTTLTTPYEKRALLPGTSPLASYLLRLVALKKTNLCLSADVSTSAELLALAEETGDSICILKTHADIISDWGDRTVKKLREIARRKRFLIFEDRKFGDIGSTVQKQYTSGPMGIIKWAEISNAVLFPGPAIITALKQAAEQHIATYNSGVSTEISAGTPATDSGHEEDDYMAHGERDGQAPTTPTSGGMSSKELRKGSVVSISTTIRQRAEPLSPDPQAVDGDGEAGGDALDRLGPPPYVRGMLILAEMSSKDNWLTGAYTEHCVEVARANREFCFGFIAQRSLNALPEDNFVVMTPGVQMAAGGDDLGQQYNKPSHVVSEKGSDIIIVGRAIYKAKSPGEEAEEFRKEAWKAYEARIRRGGLHQRGLDEAFSY